MTVRPLITDAKNTWCPGCGNFSIQHTLKNILGDMEREGQDLDKVVLVSGIGCHAKIADYLNISTFYSLHGRTIPAATGIKLANPGLTVICCAGDGDCYAEGLVHAPAHTDNNSPAPAVPVCVPDHLLHLPHPAPEISGRTLHGLRVDG